MIDKRSKFILYTLLGVIVLLFIVESTRTRPVIWNESYTSGDKIPFGCFVLYDQLDELLPGQNIASVDQTPMDFLLENEGVTNANYIFINNYLEFDKVETEYLMDFAARGNKIFIASKTAYGPLADTLNIESNYNYTAYSKNQKDTVSATLANENLIKRKSYYERGSVYRYFVNYDSLNTTVLGEIEVQRDLNAIEDFFTAEVEEMEEDEIYIDDPTAEDIPQVNFIETKVGEGAIYYNLNPIAFTNYYLLKEGGNDYVSGALSYLNEGPVYFDDYGKSGRRVVSSPMRFILSEVSLKTAYYLAIVTILLYLVIGSKRKQRIIPVIKPLPNDTVEFTKTIGSLYYESKDYSSIVNKKISFFLAKLRSTYFLPTDQLDANFIKRLTQKSGKSDKLVQTTIQLINELRQKPFHNEFELKRLSKKIEKFLNT